MKDEKISAKQLTVLVFMFTLGSAILFLPSTLTNQASQDAWLAAIFSTGLALPIVWGYGKLGNLFEGKTLIEYTEQLFGRWPGKAVSFWFILYTFILSTILLWDIGDFMVTAIIPETPIEAVYILFMAVVVYGAKLGLEPVARSSEIFLPWVVGLFIILVLFLIPSFEFQNIQPIFSKGISPIAKGAYIMLGFPFLEILLMLVYVPNLKKQKELAKSLIMGTLFGSILLIIVTIIALFVLGPDFTARNAYPTYILGKKVSIANFLERIEILVAIIWFLTIFYKLVLSFMASVIGVSQLFEMKDYRMLTIPYGMLVIVMSLAGIPSFTFLLEFTKTNSAFLLFVGLVLPAMMLVTARFKNRNT